MSEIIVKVESACSPEDIALLIKATESVRELAGDIVEIGCWKCGTTSALANANPHKKVFGFDLFGGNPYPERTEFAHLCEVDFAEIRMMTAFWPNIHLIQGKHEETIPAFECPPLSFMFVDSDWYESHVVALEYLAKHVVIGGIIAFHDWAFDGVRMATAKCLNRDEWEPIFGEFMRTQEQPVMYLRRSC